MYRFVQTDVHAYYKCTQTDVHGYYKCTHTDIHTRTHLHMFVLIYTPMPTHVHTHRHIYTHTQIPKYAHQCSRLSTQTDIHIKKIYTYRTQVYINTPMPTLVHTRMHTNILHMHTQLWHCLIVYFVYWKYVLEFCITTNITNYVIYLYIIIWPLKTLKSSFLVQILPLKNAQGLLQSS